MSETVVLDREREEELMAVGTEILELALAKGAPTAEVYLEDSAELSIEVREGEVETFKRARDRGVGLRVIGEGRLGFAYTTDFSPQGLTLLVEQALAAMARNHPDPYLFFPAPPAEGYPALALVDPELLQVPEEEKIALALRMEEEARRRDTRVRTVEAASYVDGVARVVLMNSRGIKASYETAYCGLYAAVVAEERGDAQTGFSLRYSRHYRELDPAAVGREAADKALRMLGAKSVATMQVPVIFDPYIGSSFLGLLARALTGEAVQKGKSLFAGRKGEKVGAECVTIIDDGTLAGGLASAPFDGEGVASRRTSLIEKGYLAGFLHNSYTAAKEGSTSTGNAVRGGFKSTPEVAATNLYLQPGPKPPEELWRDLDKAFYVTEVLGMHTANPVSGDFSLGAAGILIEKGRLTVPVRGVAIAGNIAELLQDIDAVASDLTFFGSKGSPTFRVRRLTVSGM